MGKRSLARALSAICILKLLSTLQKKNNKTLKSHSHLKNFILRYLHTVARCNIFVDDLLSVQIVEAGVDLDGHVHQLLSGQRVGQTGLAGALPALQ